MSTGVQVLAADGTVVLDSTKHVWSVVQTGFVPKRQSITFPLPPEIANSDIEVVITKWNGAVPGNYYIAPTPVYGITDNAVTRLTNLLAIESNQNSIRDNPYAPLPDSGDIRNNKIIYLLFFGFKEMIAGIVDYIKLADSMYGAGDMDTYQWAVGQIRDYTNTAQDMGFSPYASEGFADFALYISHGREGDFYGDIYPRLWYIVQEASIMARVGYDVNDAVLNTYTAPIVAGTTSRDVKSLPSWSISNNKLRFEADGDETVRFEVYAK
jgi:hypothetical protein